MIHKVFETAIVQLDIPPVPFPFTSFPWILLKCQLASSVPSHKGQLLFVFEIYLRLHLPASSEMRSSASYLRQLYSYRGYTGVDSRTVLPHAPQVKRRASPEKPQRKASPLPSPKGRGQRAKRFWPQTVLPRPVSPEEMQGKGGNLQQQREPALLAGIQAWFRTQVTKVFSGAAYDLKLFIYMIKLDWKGNRITESKEGLLKGLSSVVLCSCYHTISHMKRWWWFSCIQQCKTYNEA